MKHRRDSASYDVETHSGIGILPNSSIIDVYENGDGFGDSLEGFCGGGHSKGVPSALYMDELEYEISQRLYDR